ncbi:MAG: beta-galactosidase [Clostridia bacterium]|nr:beta-galactosidase [Clostridia bacterium]
MILTPRFPKFLHGGDYNPDQWLDRPDILDRDVEMMHAAHVNCVSIGIFSWARLEPEDGVYDFAWLDEVIDRLWKGGIHIILATPTGARPAWMAQKYPEVLRTTERYEKRHFGDRHNHCYTSPAYRRKVQEMNTALAERYSHHPAVIMWHLSNEYSGDCYCPLCQEAFRDFLKEKYGTLENLNRCWWTSFWSHRYTDWSQIEAPSPLGNMSNQAQMVDWRRFSTAQCKDFLARERDAVRAVNPELPCTANLMYCFWEYDYFSLAEAMDVVSWDAYPAWHDGDDVTTAASFAFHHDLMRSLKDQPFLLMESTPSQVNWHAHNKLKRPGMHLLSSMQPVAHGSQSVMYFQWRKGRGASEMFHGAVVDHYGGTDTRVFRDVTEVGEVLEKLQPIYDTQRRAEACVLYDWENQWAIDFVQTGNRGEMKYRETVTDHYRMLWERGISADIRDMRECTDLSGYKLVVTPMLFMFRSGIQEKLRAFVENGGTLVMTYFSGVVNEHYLAHLGATPNGLTDVLGLRATDLDALYPGQTNGLVMGDKTYEISELCEIPANVTARTEGTYATDFYGGMPCLTVNDFGKGQAWYLSAKVDLAGLRAIYDRVLANLDLPAALPDPLPDGVIATAREDVIFLQNYSGAAQQITLSGAYTDLITGSPVSGTFTMPVNGVMVLR